MDFPEGQGHLLQILKDRHTLGYLSHIYMTLPLSSLTLPTTILLTGTLFRNVATASGEGCCL